VTPSNGGSRCGREGCEDGRRLRGGRNRSPDGGVDHGDLGWNRWNAVEVSLVVTSRKLPLQGEDMI
jgi:hypothetical protein